MDMNMYGEDYLTFLSANPSTSVGILGDGTNGEDWKCGRLPNGEKETREDGVQFRNKLCKILEREKMVRPV